MFDEVIQEMGPVHQQLSKVYTGRTNGEAVCLAVLFSYILPRHTNMMADKGFNVFDQCADRYVHLFLRKNSAPLFPEGTVRYTHLAE